MSKLSCKTCVHLDKNTKQELGIAYRYGCRKSLNGYISFWLLNDNELKTSGCSEHKGETNARIKSM